MTFPAALRSMLRQAPNIIMIGEIRDMETASIAINASLTGHLVLSTLHTNDAPGAIARLVDIGIKPFLVSSFGARRSRPATRPPPLPAVQGTERTHRIRSTLASHRCRTSSTRGHGHEAARLRTLPGQGIQAAERGIFESLHRSTMKCAT